MTTLPDTAMDLLTAPIVGILTTIGPDGQPQTTALRYLVEDDQIRLSLNTTRQKTRNLTREPRATSFLMDPANPFRTLEVRGTVTIEPDGDFAFAERVGRHYGANLRDNDRPGETRVIASLAAAKVNTFGMGSIAES